MKNKIAIRFCTLIFIVFVMPSVVFAETVGLFFDSNVAQIKFAADDIKTALESKNYMVEMFADAFDAFRLFGADLGVAADHCRNAFRIDLLYPSDKLPRFPVRQAGYRTGVDYVYVCKIVFSDDFIASLQEFFLQGLGLILVHLTPEGVKCYFHFY
jgi:hypothetical protein